MLIIATITLFLSVLLVSAGPAGATSDPPHRYTLQELIDSAMSRNAAVAEGKAKVDGAAARLRQARAAFLLPRLRLESENGLVPDAQGNVFNPPSDTTGLRGLGPFTRTQLEFVQPLFTFGQLSNLKQAASSGLEAENASLEQTRLEVVFEVKKLYYSVLLAQDLQTLVERLSDTIDEKLAEVDVETALSLSDLYKLKLALVELDRQRDEASRQLDLARAALAWQADLPAAAPLQLEAEWLEPIEIQLPSLEQLVQHALVRRPDWHQLQAGIAARRAQEMAAHSAYYPQIFLAGGMRYAVAPGRTDQHNPFVNDGFNYLNAGVFVGVRQSFEWGLLGAEVDKTRAARRQLEAKENGAVQGIGLDVRRAYVEFQGAKASLDAAAQGRRLGRQWLKLAQEEYEFDTDTLDDLVTAFEAYARLEQDYYQAIYEHNLSLAELEKTVGLTDLSRQP